MICLFVEPGAPEGGGERAGTSQIRSGSHTEPRSDANQDRRQSQPRAREQQTQQRL